MRQVSFERHYLLLIAHRMIKYQFSGKKEKKKKKNHVKFGQNHLIFGQAYKATDKIFGQVTSAPLNETGPVLLWQNDHISIKFVYFFHSWINSAQFTGMRRMRTTSLLTLWTTTAPSTTSTTASSTSAAPPTPWMR